MDNDHDRITGRWRYKCLARYRPADRDSKRSGPSFLSRRTRTHPTPRHIPRHDEIEPDEAASGRQEASHDRHRDGERRIGHDPKGSLREAEVAGVGLNNGYRATSEPLPELPGPTG